MDGALAFIDAEVQRQADELTSELFPLLFERMLKRDSLSFCERHDKLLYPYVRAQIDLTRRKRNYYRYGDVSGSLLEDSLSHCSERDFIRASDARDEIRREYRSTPCTCWVQHR
jgi:hypothetical protein